MQKKDNKTDITDEVAKKLFDISNENIKDILPDFHREIFDFANFNEWDSLDGLVLSEKPDYSTVSIESPNIPKCYKRISFNAKSQKPLNVAFYQVKFSKPSFKMTPWN